MDSGGGGGGGVYSVYVIFILVIVALDSWFLVLGSWFLVLWRAVWIHGCDVCEGVHIPSFAPTKWNTIESETRLREVRVRFRTREDRETRPDGWGKEGRRLMLMVPVSRSLGQPNVPVEVRDYCQSGSSVSGVSGVSGLLLEAVSRLPHWLHGHPVVRRMGFFFVSPYHTIPFSPSSPSSPSTHSKTPLVQILPYQTEPFETRPGLFRVWFRSGRVGLLVVSRVTGSICDDCSGTQSVGSHSLSRSV